MHIIRALCVRSERTQTLRARAHNRYCIQIPVRKCEPCVVRYWFGAVKHFPFLNSGYCHTHCCCQAECIALLLCYENYGCQQSVAIFCTLRVVCVCVFLSLSPCLISIFLRFFFVLAIFIM